MSDRQCCIRLFERFDLPVSDTTILSRLQPDLMILFDDFARERNGMFLLMTSLITGTPGPQLKLEMRTKTLFCLVVKAVNATMQMLGPSKMGFTIEDLEAELKEGSTVEKPKCPAVLMHATRYLRVFDLSPSYMFALYKMVLYDEKHFIMAVALHLCLILDGMHRCDAAAHFEMEIEVVDEGEAVVGFEGVVWLGLLCSTPHFKADVKAALFSNSEVTLKHTPIVPLHVDKYLGELYNISILIVRGLFKYPAWSPTETAYEISTTSLILLEILMREERTFNAYQLCQLRFTICAHLTASEIPPMFGINHVITLICHACELFTNEWFLYIIRSFLYQNLPLENEPVQSLEEQKALELKKRLNIKQISEYSDMKGKESHQVQRALEMQKLHNMKAARDYPATAGTSPVLNDNLDEYTQPRAGPQPIPGGALQPPNKANDVEPADGLLKFRRSSSDSHAVDVLAMHRLSLGNGDRKSRLVKKHRSTSKLALRKKKKLARLAMRQKHESDQDDEIDGTVLSDTEEIMEQEEPDNLDLFGEWPSTADSLDSHVSINEQDYNSLYYDELDEDEDFLDLVDMFSEMFPNLSRQDLKVKIKTAAEYGDLLEELQVENEHCELAGTEDIHDQLKIEQALERHSRSTDLNGSDALSEPRFEYSATAIQLVEIFPLYDLPILEVIAVKHKHDLNRATEELLSEPSVEDILKAAEEARAEPVEPDTGAWESVLATADKVAETLRISPSEVIGHVHKHQGNYYEALVAVIRALGGKTITASKSCKTNEKPNAWENKLANPPPLKTRRRQTIEPPPPSSRPISIPTGGRVQGQRVQRGGSGRIQGRVPFGARLLEHGNNLTKIAAAPAPPLKPAAYVYDDASEEAREIRAIYESNLEFQQISMQFVQETLAFFKGNVLQAVDILIILVGNNAACLTQDFKKARPEPQDIKSLISIKLAPRHATYSLQTATSKFAQYLAKALEAARVSTQNIMEVYERNGTLDLHGLSVIQALSATHNALLQWWSVEQSKRIEQGDIHRYGTRAAFAGQVHVITGRGLHSATGKSVIRANVKKYLDRNGFSYAENLGSFVVKGRESQQFGRSKLARDETLAIETFMF